MRVEQSNVGKIHSIMLTYPRNVRPLHSKIVVYRGNYVLIFSLKHILLVRVRVNEVVLTCSNNSRML